MAEALRLRKNDEQIIQEAFMKMLTLKGWFCKSTHGNMYQSGFPDIYATHSKYGRRWIECKLPKGYKFTAAQLETFPKLSANGSPIWIITAATEEEYRKLFGPENWYHYLK